MIINNWREWGDAPGKGRPTDEPLDDIAEEVTANERTAEQEPVAPETLWLATYHKRWCSDCNGLRLHSDTPDGAWQCLTCGDDSDGHTQITRSCSCLIR